MPYLQLPQRQKGPTSEFIWSNQREQDPLGTKSSIHLIKGNEVESIYLWPFIGQQGLRLALGPNFPTLSSRVSYATGYKIFIRKPQNSTFSIEEGFNANLGTISYIGVKMVELERIPPDQGGDCANDSYLLQRFDPKIFQIMNETAYSEEVKVYNFNEFIIICIESS